MRIKPGGRISSAGTLVSEYPLAGTVFGLIKLSNNKVSDRGQPPVEPDLFLGGIAGSDSLHRLVQCLWLIFSEGTIINLSPTRTSGSISSSVVVLVMNFWIEK